MSRNQQLATLNVFLAITMLVVCFAANVLADPLPGRDRLKFSQLPMISTPVNDNNGTVQNFFGHDELSTAYGQTSELFGVPIPPTIYDGRFMADDFADKLSSPVLHVKWWGSYRRDFIDPNAPVDKFLISFESDAPATAANGFSRPDQPLLNQVVFRGSLAPGSGTFTETKIRGADPILGESLYEYNAELHMGKDFPEIKDTVYWLKIAALVDIPADPSFDPYNPQNAVPPVTQWGWHNRDYTIKDTLASTGLSSPPGGEILDGNINGTPVYHFQDDAVNGNLRVLVTGPGGIKMPDILQSDMSPQRYVDGVDGPAGGIPGTNGISHFSKDSAFNLYTVAVPEPGTCLLLVSGCVGLGMARRRRTRC